jgi:hypothetical protein
MWGHFIVGHCCTCGYPQIAITHKEFASTMGVKVKETANTTASQLRAVPLGLLDQFLTSVGGLTLVTLIEKDGNVTKPKHNKLVLGSDTFTIDEANVRWWRIKAKMLKETAPKTLLGARGWRLPNDHAFTSHQLLPAPPPLLLPCPLCSTQHPCPPTQSHRVAWIFPLGAER